MMMRKVATGVGDPEVMAMVMLAGAVPDDGVVSVQGRKSRWC